MKQKPTRLFSRAAMTLLLSVLTTMTAWADTETVSYIPLDGTETTLYAGWYYVDNDITYDGIIECHGDVHIILADGKTMTINGGGYGINVNGSLTIYGQAKGTGTLNVTGDDHGIHSESGFITICGGTVNVTGGNAGIFTESGSITISGGRVTATGENGPGISTLSGTITLGCTTASDFIYASSYFIAGPQGSLKIAYGKTLYDEDGTEYSGTLNNDAFLDGATLRSFPHVIAQYIDADGTSDTHDAIVLGGTESTLGQDEQETWYYVGNDITYNGTIYCDGDVNIILADGKTMTINSGNNGIVVYDGGSLTIYGQAKGTGTLNATGDGDGISTYSGTITIYGGTVNATATATSEYAAGIFTNSGDITISGGRVTATATSENAAGIYADSGTITLGCTTASDFIYASSYLVGDDATLNIADGQTLYDEDGKKYSGTLSADKISAIRGKKLTPDLSPSLTRDGNVYTINNTTGWNYFCDMQEGGETFSGKTVVLAGDIGTPENPVTRMGSSTTRFKGTFDGQGHTLTVQYGTPSEPVDQQFVAPFPVVEGAATFRNLTIAGSIYSGYATNGDKGTGGLIGHLFGGVTVEHCVSTVTVNAASDRAGGFVGLCEHAVTFTDCVSSAIVTCTGSGSGFVGWSRDSKYTIAFYGCLFDGKVLKQGNVGSGNGSFVGWKGFTKTVTITNCLAAPATDENMATDNSATFCRYSADTTKDNQATTITNCYYTQTLGTAQGKARHTVTAGTDVTVAHAGVATHYATSGITAYKATGASTDSDLFIAGLLYNDDDSDVLYAGIDDEVALTLSNTATGGDVPAGYRYDVYTVSAGTLTGSTLTMPDADVTVNVDTETLRSTGQAVSVSYIGANGQPATHDAIALDGTETTLGQDEQATWYYVGTGISYSDRISCYGDVHIILADGKTMTINSDGICIEVNGSLTIYGQAKGTGTLNVTSGIQGIFSPKGDITISGGTVKATCTFGNGISTYRGTITISGGTVNATATGDNAGIFTDSGTITISGGTVTATGGNGAGIYTESGTITICGGTVATGGIYTNSGTITISGGRVTVTGDGDGIHSDSGTITISGGRVTAKGGYGIFTSSGTITLGCTTASDFIYASSYLLGPGGRLKIANGQTLYDEDGNYYSDQIYDYPYGKTLRPFPHVIAQYIDAAGKPASHDAIVLDGTETTLGESDKETWYYVDNDITYNGTINCYGDVHIILADGKTMTINSDGNGIVVYDDGSLTIYGQELGTGTLEVSGHFGGIYTNGGNITISGGTVTATSDNGFGISTSSGNITISGGRVTATGDNGYGISTGSGNITIYGGRVTATGDNTGISTDNGNITLGCTTASDFIYASSYGVGPNGKLKIADGQTLYDEYGTEYSGTLSYVTIPDGATLRPLKNVLALYDSEDNSEAINGSNNKSLNVILYGRTLYKDGEWNTLCLPFDVSTISGPLSGDNVQAMILNNSEGSGTGFDASTGVLTLNFSDATSGEQQGVIPAGTPFIIRWGTPDDNPGTTLTDPVFEMVNVKSSLNEVPFTGGTFRGTYAWQEYTQENKSILLLGAENTLYWPQPDGDTYPSIGAFRAYFELGGGQQARQFVLNFGEIETSLPQPLQREGSQAGAWFDLSGRKLDSKPTKKGLYIHGGRKVVIP